MMKHQLERNQAQVAQFPNVQSFAETIRVLHVQNPMLATRLLNVQNYGTRAKYPGRRDSRLKAEFPSKQSRKPKTMHLVKRDCAMPMVGSDGESPKQAKESPAKLSFSTLSRHQHVQDQALQWQLSIKRGSAKAKVDQHAQDRALLMLV